MTQIGFDDFIIKYDYYDARHHQLLDEWCDAIVDYGYLSLASKIYEKEQCKAYIQKQCVLIEIFIEDDDLRIVCVGYVKSVGRSYAPEKAKDIIDAFMEIVRKPKNWITLQVFMRLNPVP